MKRTLPLLIIAVVLVAAMAAMWMLLRSQKSGASANYAASKGGQISFTDNASPAPTAPVAEAPPGADPPHIRGNVNAAVTVEEFGDFQCPSCGVYYSELKKIESEFGDRIRVIFRERPLIPPHEHALTAAQAAEAAGLQGRFWEMHDKLYETQATWSVETNLVPIFVDYAKQIGLDTEQFKKDLNGEAVSKRIFEDGTRAHAFGINSTPTFFVNGKEAKDESWKPEGLRAMIRQALQEAGK